MPPLFCSADVQFDNIVPYLQAYVKQQGLSRWLIAKWNETWKNIAVFS